MSEILLEDKVKLNTMSKSVPSMFKEKNPPPTNILYLGDYVEKALSCVTVQATWSFDVHGGMMVPDIDLGTVIPAGAIVQAVMTDVIVPVTSLGAPEFKLSIGGTNVIDVLDATLLVGVAAQTVTPVKLVSAAHVLLNIDTAAATAGKVRFLITYVNP